MEIKLSKTSSDKREITKVLTDEITLTGTLRNETLVLDPDVLIEIENPTIYNYMTIEAFNRYYFITEMEHIRQNLWRIKGHVDVLFTYANEIKNSKALVDYTANTYANYYLSDEIWKINTKHSTEIINFPSGFNESGEFILITAGG